MPILYYIITTDFSEHSIRNLFCLTSLYISLSLYGKIKIREISNSTKLETLFFFSNNINSATALPQAASTKILFLTLAVRL